MYFESTNTGKPTEIFVPKRHYTSGFNIEVDGTDNWSHTYDEDSQIVSLNIEGAGEQLRVTITSR